MKATLGIIMIVIGSIIGVGFLGSLPQSISDIGRITANKGWTAYAYGRLTAMIVFPVIAFLLIRYGIRFCRSSPTKPPSV